MNVLVEKMLFRDLRTPFAKYNPAKPDWALVLLRDLSTRYFLYGTTDVYAPGLLTAPGPCITPDGCPLWRAAGSWDR